jgi:hypothetical protein
MSNLEFSRKASQLQVFFSEKVAALSRETNFVQRSSKMSGVRFVQTLVLGWLAHPTASLSELVQVRAALGVNISVPGLQQRLNTAAVDLLKALVTHALSWFREQTQLPDTLLSRFKAVQIVDSSLITLPEALRTVFPGTKPSAGLKLQLSFDYLSGNLNAIDLLAGRTPDQNSPLPTAWASAGSLTLFDLGFFKKARFAEIAQAGGYFISRLLTQTNLYAQPDSTHPLDLWTFLSTCGAQQGEVSAYLHTQQPLHIRLIYTRLPDQVVAERRRKARANAHRRGEACSARHLALLAWSLFITNVPSAWLATEQIVQVYRVRWQIELIFKLWKSYAKLDVIGNWRVERVLCQFYAHLLGLILFHWSVASVRCLPRTDVSLPKAFNLLQRSVPTSIAVMVRHGRGAKALLRHLHEAFRRFALKTSRRTTLSTYQLLQASTA